MNGSLFSLALALILCEKCPSLTPIEELPTVWNTDNKYNQLLFKSTYQPWICTDFVKISFCWTYLLGIFYTIYSPFGALKEPF